MEKNEEKTMEEKVKQKGRGEVKDKKVNKCSSINHCPTGTNGLRVGLGDVDKGVVVIPETKASWCDDDRVR